MFSQPLQNYNKKSHHWALYPRHLNLDEDEFWPPVAPKTPAGNPMVQPGLQRVASEDYGYDSSDEHDDHEPHHFGDMRMAEEEVFHLEMGDESDDESTHEMTKILSPDTKQKGGMEELATTLISEPDSIKEHQLAGFTGCSMGGSDYLTDVYRWKLSLEPKFEVGNIFDFQTDIMPEMRTAVLEWLVAVNRQFSYELETLYLAVNLMDRFLSRQLINRDCLQLVGLTCFFIAAKHEEVEPPEISELVSLCARSYQPQQFRWMECIILSMVKFEIMSPTIPFFLFHHLQAGVNSQVWPVVFLRMVLERLLCEGAVLTIRPSAVASALHGFLTKNFVMTCLVANMCGTESAHPVFCNFYDMILHDLTKELKKF